MNNLFILDACALIALLAGEPGAEKVRSLIQDAISGKGILVTSDHTDMEKLENAENIKIDWFR